MIFTLLFNLLSNLTSAVYVKVCLLFQYKICYTKHVGYLLL